MIELVPCTIVGVFGPVASGKTFLVKRWLELENRFVVFDATGEHLKHKQFTEIWAEPKQLVRVLRESPYYFKVAYVPGVKLPIDFECVTKVLWMHPTHKLLVVDECHLICPVNAIDEEVETTFRFARHDKMGWIGCSQRIADVHKLFTSSCRMIILFWTQEARDLDAVRDRWGRTVEQQVINLRPCIYDDVTQKCSQIPQCLVVVKGQAPRVFDFQADAYV